MPKKIDPELRARAVRLVTEHRAQYPTETAAVVAVAKQLGVSRESVRRWMAQAGVDAGDRPGVTTEDNLEIRKLKAENKRLREQGCQIAARTYRAQRSGRRGLSSRTVTDAQAVEAIRQVAFFADVHGRRQLAPEGLYGRRKMLAHLRRAGLEVIAGAVDRGMRLLGLSGVVGGQPHRTTIADRGADRAPDLLNRDFTADAPNLKWVTDFTYVRSWSGFVYVAFILDVYAQRIVAWHAQCTKTVDLVSIPLRMALWERDRQGHPAQDGELIHHSGAGSRYTAVKLTENLALHGIQPSIGSVGDAYDNALMECINGLYKTECIRTQVFHQGPYRTIGDVEYATAGWVDWYNNRRLHSSIGMIPPAEHEQPTTLPSTESSNPHRSGTKPRAVHD